MSKEYFKQVVSIVFLILFLPRVAISAVPASAVDDLSRLATRGVARLSHTRNLDNLVRRLSSNPAALNDSQIDELAKLSSTNRGTEVVGRRLAELAPFDTDRNEILEDAYLRILLAQEKIERSEAEHFFKDLKGIPGFRETLRKISGNNQNVSSGHLNELRLANATSRSGVTVRAIAMPFNDPLKNGLTDIDLVLQHGQRIFAIEAKDYAPTTRLPIDSFRADMDSLRQYEAASPSLSILKVFTLSNRPESNLDYELIRAEASRRGIELLIGSPEEIVIQIRQMIRVLAE